MGSTSWVHLGSWTNWAEGRIAGSRITLTDVGGAYLIAFLALFVRLAGQHSWGIFCYLVFKLREQRARDKDDRLKHSSQSILRNSSLDTTAAWQFLSLTWAPQFSGKNRVARSLVWTFTALLHAAAFIVAGIFVSKIAETRSSEVLLRGPACGVWQNPNQYVLYDGGSQSDILENNLWSAWDYNVVGMASEFARQCYNATSSTKALANCNAYAPNLVEWNVSTEISCPFENKMCRDGHAVRFDSGYLDSLTHFGINAGSHDRVKYRHVVECSPLVREGYVSSLLNVSEVQWPPTPDSVGLGLPQENGIFQEYRYGVNTDFNMSATFIWNNDTIGQPAWGNLLMPTYATDEEIYMPDNPDASSFQAINELHRSDADTVLFFLMNAGRFISPVHDPWFQATMLEPSTQYQIFVNEDPKPLDVYRPDFRASVVGCTQQFQYCNHDASKCSALRGEGYGGSLVDSIVAFSNGLDLTKKQFSALDRIAQASWNSDLYIVPVANGGASLLAQLTTGSALAMPALPNNQWILEMQHYFLIGLTSMQMQLAQYVTGPPDETDYQYFTKLKPEEEWMCTSQIVQRTGYTTFSVLGVGIVLSVGAILVIVNLTLPNVRVVKRRKYINEGEVKERGWDAYSHLNRLLREIDGEQRPESELETTPWSHNINDHLVDPSTTTLNSWRDRPPLEEESSPVSATTHSCHLPMQVSNKTDSRKFISTYVNTFSVDLEEAPSIPRPSLAQRIFGRLKGYHPQEHYFVGR